MRPSITVMADLDAVLDTRLGLLDYLDANAAIKVFESEDYYFRLVDDFSFACNIKQEQFQAAWVNRDKDLLKRSMITPVIFTLKSMITQLELKLLNSPVAPTPTLKINYWPYKLNKDELNAIRKALAHYSGVTTQIHMVSYTPHETSLGQLKKGSYGGYFTYSFKDWLEGSLNDLKTVTDPRFQLFIPSIFPSDKLEDVFKGIDVPNATDPLKIIEGAFAEFFALDIMPAFMYCIYRPDKHEEWMNRAYHAVVKSSDQHPFIKKEEELERQLDREGKIPMDLNVQPLAPADSKLDI